MTLKFFQDTFDALPAHIAILDGEGTIVAVNAAWMRFAKENGLAHPLDGVGVNYLYVCDYAEGPGAEGARDVARGIRSVLGGAREEYCTDYMCHGPAVQRWFELRVRLISQDGPWRVLVVHENITSKKLAEIELRDRERRLSLALEAGGMGAFEFSLDEDRLKVSRRFCQIVGIEPREEVPYGEWIDRVHPEDRWNVVALEQKLRETNTPLDIEYRLLAPAGVRWVRVMASPEAENGQVQHIYGVIEDITEKKAAETELRRSSSVVEQSPVSVVVTDLKGTIEYVNPKFCATTGYTPLEVIGMNPRLLKSGEMSKDIYRGLWTAILSGEVWHGEFHNRKKNGELFWERASIAPIRDRKGLITHFAAVKEDITEWKRNEAALHEAEERYRSLFDRSLESMYVHDFAGRFIDLNATALELLGYDKADLPRLEFANVLIPEDVSAAEEVVREVLATGTHAGVKEFTVRRKDGSLRRVECKSALLMRDGRPYAVHGVARDITVRTQADEALRMQLMLRERLAKIVENAPGVIYTFRMRPDGTGCMPYASAALETLFGVRAEDWRENSDAIIGLIHDEDRERAVRSVHESARTLARWHCEFRVNHPTRGVIWIEGQSTPEREPDGCTIWHGFMSDITERKRTETELAEHKENEERARRALEHEKELNQVKSQFVSLVSHEFRSPLCVINMAAAMLDEYLERMSAEDRSRNLRQIQRAVVRMTRMMEDLLVHERLSMGVTENTPTEVNLDSLCRTIVPEVTGCADQIGVDVEAGIGSVMLDEPLVTHVLTNLLGNAIKYSPENARVDLEVRTVTNESGDRKIRFSVRDRGIGIPEAELPFVFLAFRRCSNVENRPGTGMGLPIVKQCVELLGGTVRIESRLGEGTVAVVHLPYVAVSAAEPAIEAAPVQAGAGI